MANDSEDDVSMDMEAPSTDGPLFWSMKLTPNQATEIDQPAIEGYIVHITNACFGANVNKGSRTVVVVDPSADEGDDDTAAPVCVLRQGQQENQSLDLLFNESASFSLKGQKPSNVFLTGYIQPPVDGEPMGQMDPMYEDMDEEQIMSALKAQREQAEALDADEGDDEVSEPPAKKQKTASGAVAKKGKNNQNKKEDKKRKGKNNQQQKQKEEDAKEENTADEEKGGEKKKNTKQNKKKKNTKMTPMKGGIQYRDMKVGDGAQVKNGDKLRVYYVGQTDDKKVFDKCISGPGFEFAFGAGDVIKGWDMGLKNMKVGGKRKLVIPPKLAYGAAGSPPNVPGNATLTFTIELKGKA